MLKKLGLPVFAMLAGLFLANPAPAKAAVQFGVQIGPSYPAYSYGYPAAGYYGYPYSGYYANPYPSYYYSSPRYYRNPSFGYRDYRYDRRLRHQEREWREHRRGYYR